MLAPPLKAIILGSGLAMLQACCVSSIRAKQTQDDVGVEVIYCE